MSYNPGVNAAYHQLADARTVLGIPNFWNVVSNLPFLVAGVLGLLAAARSPRGWRRNASATLFGSVGLTAFGSAYYHLAPSDSTLFWDRLPMAVAFMALLAILLGQRRIWMPLVAAGAASVLYWRLTGGLWMYGLVQYGSLLAVFAMALRDRLRPVLLAVGWYALAKVFENFDQAIWNTGFPLSGHTLKHLAAGAGVACLRGLLTARTESLAPAGARTTN